MKNTYSTILVGVVLSAFVALGCASSANTGTRSFDNKVKENPRVHVQNPTTSLADYLRRVPGVNVRGAGSGVQVVVQGVSTLMGDPSPLYYINQVRVGRNYDQVASMLNMHDVDNIEVVKGVAASAYGVEGGNGVIIIHTKKF